MVVVVRKSTLPSSAEVPEPLRAAAQAAGSVSLREPRSAGFPLFFTNSMQIIEPVVAFLHEHGIQRAHTADTVRAYAEIAFDWFDTLEQSSISWDEADGVDLVAYRNRMLTQSRTLQTRSGPWSMSALRQAKRPLPTVSHHAGARAAINSTSVN